MKASFPAYGSELGEGSAEPTGCRAKHRPGQRKAGLGVPNQPSQPHSDITASSAGKFTSSTAGLVFKTVPSHSDARFSVARFSVAQFSVARFADALSKMPDSKMPNAQMPDSHSAPVASAVPRHTRHTPGLHRGSSPLGINARQACLDTGGLFAVRNPNVARARFQIDSPEYGQKNAGCTLGVSPSSSPDLVPII